MTRIFVYGSLKRGGENHRHLKHQEFLGAARTAPMYRLFELDGYPGMVQAEDGVSVQGELWEVDPDCLRRLDLLEGLHVGLYRRVHVAIEGHPHDHLVETYLYNRPTVGCKELGTEFPTPPPAPADEIVNEAKEEKEEALEKESFDERPTEGEPPTDPSATANSLSDPEPPSRPADGRT